MPDVKPTYLSEPDKKKYLKEISIKHWQIACLDRLIEEGVLEKTGTTYQTQYHIISEDYAKTILKDYENDGTMLAYFLFPTEVPRPSLSEMVFGKSEIEPVKVEIEAPPEIDLNVIFQFLQLIGSAVADVKERQANQLKASLDVFDALLKPFKDLVIEQSVGLGKILLPQLESINSRLDNKLGSLNKRVNDLDDTVKASMRLAESTQASIKKLGNIETLLTQVAESNKGTQELQSSVNDLVKLVKSKEQNKLSDIISALKRNTEEGQQLQQMILDAIAEN